jgi:hypothetical protein
MKLKDRFEIHFEKLYVFYNWRMTHTRAISIGYIRILIKGLNEINS